MKKLAILLLVWAGITQVMLAQEPQELRMAIGDTVVWQPFDDCNNIGYSISGPKVISFKHLHWGEKIQIIASRVGQSSIVADCNDNGTKAVVEITVIDPNDVPVVVEKPVKPATLPFTGTYNFSPPADHFFITITDQGSHVNETYMKLGDNEAYNDGMGVDRFWNLKTGKNWYYRPDAQGWTDDVDWEFEPLGESFAPLNSFANEVEKDDLSKYYVGMEKVLDIDCWKFFVDFEDGTVIQYWVDPSNGCTLQRQMNNDAARTVTVYDLNYTRLYFGPSFKKGLHDTTR